LFLGKKCEKFVDLDAKLKKNGKKRRFRFVNEILLDIIDWKALGKYEFIKA
jgi:hypothetical protein